MPLVSCPHCLGKLSTAAPRCPSCGRSNASRTEDVPAPWSQSPPYAAGSATSYGSAGGSSATVVEVPVGYAPAPGAPQELECPVCRLHQKHRTFCSFCDERLVEPRFNRPHHFPRVPVDYADFGQRWMAGFLDTLVLVPVYAAFRLLLGQDPAGHMLALCVWVLGNYAYRIGFTAATGQTPGKMLMGIQVRRADGRTVGLGEASLRYVPEMVFGAAILLMMSLITSNPGGLETLDDGARAGMMGAALVVGVLQILYPAYLLGEVISFYATPRHRTLHDFLASTVVVHKG